MQPVHFRHPSNSLKQGFSEKWKKGGNYFTQIFPYYGTNIVSKEITSDQGGGLLDKPGLWTGGVKRSLGPTKWQQNCRRFGGGGWAASPAMNNPLGTQNRSLRQGLNFWGERGRQALTGGKLHTCPAGQGGQWPTPPAQWAAPPPPAP